MTLLGSAVSLAKRTPLQYIEWLPGQLAYLQCEDRYALLRAGNQAMGKTTVGVADLLWQARGEHPYRPAPKRPATYWIVSSSEQNSGVLAAKLVAMCPPGWLHPASVWQPEKGHFKGKYPMCRIRHIGGGYSEIFFRWTGQRALNLAGATVAGALFDEPPATQRAFREVERRMTRTGGEVRLTFTPVNAPVAYLREMCDAGDIRDIHFKLKPENLIPVGRTQPLRTHDGRPMDATWIAEQRRLVLPFEAPVILDGEWEFRMDGQALPAFDPKVHVSKGRVVNAPGFPRHDLDLAIGIDYGDDEHRQVAVLVAVDNRGEHTRVWVLDEYSSTGRTTTEQDAAGVLAMLERNGIRWQSIDFVHGDKRYIGRRGEISLKSNRQMHDAVARLLGVRRRALSPPIHSAKRGRHAGAGSRFAGVRWLHESMIRKGHFLVDPRCKVLTEALGKWAWGEPFKDPIDALRYALKPWILDRRVRKRGAPPAMR